jgi:hypothetical protein
MRLTVHFCELRRAMIGKVTVHMYYVINNNNIFQVISLNNNNTVYAHLSSNLTQTWIDRQNSLKIQFSYLPEQPMMDDPIQLQFSIQNLQTGNHLKNLIAKLTLINTSYGE